MTYFKAFVSSQPPFLSPTTMRVTSLAAAVLLVLLAVQGVRGEQEEHLQESTGQRCTGQGE